MKKLLAIIVLGLLWSGNAFTNPNVSPISRDIFIYEIKKPLYKKYYQYVLYSHVNNSKFLKAKNELSSDKQFIKIKNLAATHCRTLSKNFYHFSDDLIIEDDKFLKKGKKYIRFICSDSLKQIAYNLIDRDYIPDRTPRTYSVSTNNVSISGRNFTFFRFTPGDIISNQKEFDREESKKISDIIMAKAEEIIEKKKKIKAERASVINKKRRDKVIAKLEVQYGEKCSGSFFNKKFEKGTKEYENCLIVEKKSSDKKRVEVAKKLSSMTPKERHAYNCSTAFKFRKGSEKFNDCVFKLYTAELDMQKLELEKQVAEAQIQAAANQQARAEAVANAQIAAAKAAKRAASLNSSIQMMQMGSSMLGSSAPKSNSSFGIENRVRTTCRNVGGFINCN